MTDTSQFVGLSEREAKALAKNAGLRVAVSVEKVPILLTASMEYDRLTLVVRGGFVVDARIG